MRSSVINLVSNNKGKLLAAQSAFFESGILIKQLIWDKPEIQAETGIEIAKFTALEVAKTTGLNVIRQDDSLFLGDLGFPGPFTNFIQKRLSLENLLKILESTNTWDGYFELCAVYAEPNGFFKEFSYKVPIKLSRVPRGESQNSWDKLIMLNGEKRTIAEYPEKERFDVWNKNFKAIVEFLKKAK